MLIAMAYELVTLRKIAKAAKAVIENYAPGGLSVIALRLSFMEAERPAALHAR